MDPYTDAETGFVYLRARYYAPATGQFISRDPVTAMTGQPCSYVDNNPLNSTDPLGLSSWSWVKDRAKGVLQPFNVAWTSAGFFIVRPLAYAALVAAGIEGAPLVAGLAAATVLWFVAGRVVKHYLTDPPAWPPSRRLDLLGFATPAQSNQSTETCLEGGT